MFGITIVREPKAQKTATKPKARRTAKPKTPDGLAIDLAMAALRSTLGDEVTVPIINVTVGALRTVAEGKRPNDTVGRWYPAAHGHSDADALAATTWLIAQGQRPKGGARRQPATPVPATPAAPSELDSLKAQVQELMLLVAGGAATEALPEAPKEPELPLVEVDGEIFQVVTWKDGTKHLKLV